MNIQEVKDLCKNFKPNQYAKVYIDALNGMSREEDVLLQIPYILTNIRASTPEAKEAKKKLNEIYKREYLDK